VKRKSGAQSRPQVLFRETPKTKIRARLGSHFPRVCYGAGVEEKDPFELVTALRSQVTANVERLRRTREMVEVISQHLDHTAGIGKKRKKKPS
jgi:hypothetical protein